MASLRTRAQRVRCRRARLGEPWRQDRRSSAGGSAGRVRARRRARRRRRRRCSATSTARSRRSRPRRPRRASRRPFRELLAALVAATGSRRLRRRAAPLEDGRRMIPLDGAAYVGTHGLETMAAGGSVTVEPQAERYVAAIHEIAEAAARDLDCEALGVVLEDKRTVLAVHYRLARTPRPRGTRSSPAWSSRPGSAAWPSRPATSPSRCGRRCRSPRARRSRRLLAAGDYPRPWAAATTSRTSPPSPPSATGASATRGADACAVAAVTDETPRPVADAADVLVRATPGRPRGAVAPRRRSAP